VKDFCPHDFLCSALCRAPGDLDREDRVPIHEQVYRGTPSNGNAYINLLRPDGTITLVGAPTNPLGVSAFGHILGRRSLSGSNIGGIGETQEMLDFCGAHHITADVEVIPIQKVNDAYERLLKSDVKYRFAIDMASLKSE
jgi:alcohol dehydrogenase (NADP+)